MSIRKFILYFCIFGDSLIKNVLPDRSNPKDQIFCILIQAFFVPLFCVPLTIIILPLFLLLSSHSDILLFEVSKYIYLLLVLTFMVHILLNQSNKEYSFPKIIIEVYFTFKYLLEGIKIKSINTIITFTLLFTMIYFIIIIGSKLLTYYP